MNVSRRINSTAAVTCGVSRRHSLAMLGLGAAALAARPSGLFAQGRIHSVVSHNRTPGGEQMAFAPAVLQIAPGDSLRFTHADRGHNVQTYDEMLPPGASGFSGAINEEIEVTFEAEGIYGFYCRPHQAMGMIGFVLVGDFTGNLDQVRAAAAELRGPTMARRVQQYFDEIDSLGQDAGLIQSTRVQ